jgi:hypothetical protein
MRVGDDDIYDDDNYDADVTMGIEYWRDCTTREISYMDSSVGSSLDSPAGSPTKQPRNEKCDLHVDATEVLCFSHFLLAITLMLITIFCPKITVDLFYCSSINILSWAFLFVLTISVSGLPVGTTTEREGIGGCVLYFVIAVMYLTVFPVQDCAVWHVPRLLMVLVFHCGMLVDCSLE